MAMTTLPRETLTPEAPTQEPSTGRHGVFGWLVVAVALVAASVLAVLVLAGGDDPADPQPWYSVEHGSIAAIDHAAQAAEVANRPSAAAADHAAAPTAQGPAEASAENGSVTAIDHEADADETEAG